MIPEHVLDFYTQPSAMTSAGGHAAMFSLLPNDVGALVSIVQGLVLHEFAATPFYGVSVSEERKSESHIRRVSRMLDVLLAIDPLPLNVPRPPDKRLVGVCHHHALLLVAMLRAKGIPARARCGFGSYFNAGVFEDHWVCEYWKAAEERWALADPQFDDVWRAQLHIEHDILDVPRDRFLSAADAWAQCRAGKADPSAFGIFRGNLRGLWFVAGSVVRDTAALNRMEMLPWDVWGAMPKPGETVQRAELAFFDRVVRFTAAPDQSFAELRRLYEEDDRLYVPGTVFNAVLDRPEALNAMSAGG